MQKINSYTLDCRYDARNSFYGKARVFVLKNNIKALVSYDTPVCLIEDDTAYIEDVYTQTTLRHIKEFLNQNGFNAETKKQIIKEYRVSSDIFNKKIKKYFEQR